MYLAVGLSVAFFCVCLVCNVTECPDRTLIFHSGIFLGFMMMAGMSWMASAPRVHDDTDDDYTDDDADDIDYTATIEMSDEFPDREQ